MKTMHNSLARFKKMKKIVSVAIRKVVVCKAVSGTGRV